MPDGSAEQIFTWPAALRETQKAGKRMPDQDQLLAILPEVSRMPGSVQA
jgi:hypothetical protein